MFIILRINHALRLAYHYLNIFLLLCHTENFSETVNFYSSEKLETGKAFKGDDSGAKKTLKELVSYISTLRQTGVH